MIDRADKKYNYLAFSKAIPIYKKALKKDSTNTQAWARLGNCYRENNQTINAEEAYASVVNDPNAKSIYKLNYAQMLMSNGKYLEARKWLANYAKEVPQDKRGADLASGLSHVEKFFINKDNYTVQKLNINTDEAEYGPAFYKDGLVFTSSRKSDGGKSKTHTWTGKSYYSLFYAKGKSATFDEPVIFLKGVQTKYNNSSVCFNKNGTEMVLTRNNLENKLRDEDEVLKLKLYFSILKDGQWSSVVPFQYNSDDYSCAHPALSPDGQKLYFASDMPGSIGGMDLWVCTRTGQGWGVPKNMGTSINTMGNELFPTVADDGTIYFSSNGHEGIGGLDIYSTKDSGDTYAQPRNLGAPYNSSDDDFGLIVDNSVPGKPVGYFSSNRTRQGNNDDIFTIKERIILLKGLVVDKSTNKSLDSATVRIIDETSAVEMKQVGKDGDFSTIIQPEKKYTIIAERQNFTVDTLSLTDDIIKSQGDTVSVTIPLGNEISIDGKISSEVLGTFIEGATVTLVKTNTHDTLRTTTNRDGYYSFGKVQVQSDYRITVQSGYCDSKSVDTSTTGMLGNTALHVNISLFCLTDNMVLKNIYYDLDKSNIRPDAAKELDKLVELLKKFPNVRIELGSHTDCRASKAYNMRLSERRAASAVEYLEKSGILRRRLVARGYGESKPVNKCECEGTYMVPCTEEEYQLNRRTEIKIIALN